MAYAYLDYPMVRQANTNYSVESKNQRQKGVEVPERVARVFVEQVLEGQPGEVLTLTNAYLIITDFLK